jgi:hypothetical protein
MSYWKNKHESRRSSRNNNTDTKRTYTRSNEHNSKHDCKY